MISQIKGSLKQLKENRLLIDVGGISYDVLVPAAILRALENDHLKVGDSVELYTFHYHQVEPSRSTPILIGFLNEIEREFFERFITVSGVGPKAACKALSEPISVIAQAIDRGDDRFLQSLPGIGAQRSREIIAKLQGKVGKFGLIQDRDLAPAKGVLETVEAEALEILLQLQYKRQEAERMIQEALHRRPEIETAEDLLNEVYRQRTKVR